ncbi:Type I restriction-modification system, specificity subunit S (plasmid) [Lactiplantibacillus plantarum]|uniref:restriction endonuclease subunit S n=2 Tax=Lactiplantibacillus plantarum TaxID=1590 RepID=UPI0039BC5BB1
MKDNQAKYPQLRFKGFTDPWEQCKLRGILAERNDQITETNEYPLMSFVQGKGVTPKGKRYNRSFLVKDVDKKYKKTELGDFIYSSNNLETGSIGFNRTGKAVISPVYSIFKSKREQESQFIGIMSARKDFIFKMIRFRQGVVYGQWRIHESDFLNIDIRIPSYEEQQSIICFFEKLNKAITLHQRKLAKLKELKQGYLQKLFPQNGSKFPQLRFAGFADAWEQRKLGEEAQLTMGQSPNSENYTKNPDDYILVQGNADMKNGRVVPRVWTTQITKKAEKSDLILSVRAPVGDIGKTDYDVVLGRGVAAIKGNEFIFQQLGKMKLTGYWTRYSTGSTFESINSNDIKDAKIMVPVEEEQQKIGAFFKQLDDTIVLHQRKLEKLQELKKGYLQKMFC